jgi:hypothetical protein
LKAVREKKHITYKGKPIKTTADFSMETLKANKGMDFRSSANAVMLLDLGHTLRGEHIWEEWG